MISALIPGIVLFVLFGIIMPLAKSRYSINNTQNQTGKTLDQLKKEYKRYQLFSVILTLMLIPTLSYFTYHLFVLIESSIPLAVNNDSIIVTPARSIFIIIIIFTTIINIDVVSFFLLKLLLKDRFLEFEYYYNSTYGFNTRRFMRSFKLYFVAPLFLILFFLGSNWYVEFSNDQIAINKFLSLSEIQYSIKDVSEIYKVAKRKALNGNIKGNEHYAIKFYNEDVWLSDMAISFPSTKLGFEQGIKKLTKLTDKPIKSIDYLE